MLKYLKNKKQKRRYLLYGTHSYWTSKYLYVPGQGSGKTSGPATTAHWVRLLHLREGKRQIMLVEHTPQMHAHIRE